MGKPRAITIRSLLLRLPFTVSLLLILSVVGWVTESHRGALSQRWLHRLGLGPADLYAWRWQRLLTATVTTDGGFSFWSALGISALCVGGAEELLGTNRSLKIFWGGHLLTWCTEAFFFTPLLHRLGLSLDGTLLTARDVGPSAGYVACLAALLGELPARWRNRTRLLVWSGFLAVPLVRITLTPLPSAAALLADIAHIIAFPVGWLFAVAWKRS